MMKDYLVKALACNEHVRIYICSSTHMAEEARKRFDLWPTSAAALGRVLTVGSMMGSMLKGEEDLLTLQVTGDGPMGGMTVTADSKGHVKGYANEPQVILPANSQGKLDVGGAVGSGILRVIQDSGLKDPYVGQTVLQTGEIAEDLTYYFATSEQVPSSVGLGVLMERDNTVRQAGGFIVQLMPFAEEETISRLEQNLGKIRSVTSMLDEGLTPEELLGLVLEGMDIQFRDTCEVEFSCSCSKERVEKALIDAGFGERLERLPKGLDTQLYKDFSDEGVEVSGGEAQKIAIARALYKNAPFIILDEPTAALDPIAEAEIYAQFNQIAGDKTAIYISHRLSSCRFCDEIMVFDRGQIGQPRRLNQRRAGQIRHPLARAGAVLHRGRGSLHLIGSFVAGEKHPFGDKKQARPVHDGPALLLPWAL